MAGAPALIANPNPNPNHSLPPPPPSYSPFHWAFPFDAAAAGGGRLPGFERPPIRLTSEFDSEASVFFHKMSCKLFDGLAKMKLSFQNDVNGGVAFPAVEFLTKNFSVFCDVENRNAILKGSVDVANFLQVRATHNVMEQHGELSMIAKLGDPSYKLELSSSVPSVGLPKATLHFPIGEVSVEEQINKEDEKVLSVNGIVKSNFLNGVCTAVYRENDLNLRYCYKDAKLSFIPSISLPSNAVSCALKHRFSPADKMSFWYHFDSNNWNAIYKRTVAKDIKFKAGYDSEAQLGWASLWVGDEDGKAKTAPRKTKLQFMLQVARDEIKNPLIMFRVKKRWDF